MIDRSNLIFCLKNGKFKKPKALKYIVENGNIIIDPSQIIHDKGEVWYNMSIVVEYVHDGQAYSSVTAVTIFG